MSIAAPQQMILQPRDFDVLCGLAIYLLLCRQQIQQRHFPDDKTGRITRRRVYGMLAAGYIRSPELMVPSPVNGKMSPVFYLSPKGREALAEWSGDETIFSKPITLPQPNHVQHALAVSEFHFKLRQATDAHADVNLLRFVNENEPTNLAAPEAQQIKLFLELQKRPRIVVNPDGAWLLQYQQHKTVYYLERERSGQTSPNQLLKRKAPGYEALRKTQHHTHHFPDTTFAAGFTVCCVTRSVAHRKNLVKAFAGNNLRYWRIAADTELTPETLLTAPVWYRPGDDSPSPLVQTA